MTLINWSLFAMVDLIQLVLWSKSRLSNKCHSDDLHFLGKIHWWINPSKNEYVESATNKSGNAININISKLPATTWNIARITKMQLK